MKNQIQIPSYIPWKTATTTPDRFWIPGGALEYEGTGAGSVYTSYVPGYQLPDGIASYARGVVPFPPNWGGRRLKILASWRANAGTATGNVRFDAAIRRILDGGTISTTYESVTGKIDAASGNTDISTVTVISGADWGTTTGGTAPTNIGANEFLSIALSRRGDVGADDTFAHPIFLISVEIVAY